MVCEFQVILKNLRLLQTDKARQAQSILNNYCGQGFVFLNILHSVLTNPQIDEWVKMSASSMLNSAICNNICDLSQTQCSELLIKIMGNQKIKMINKRALQRSIIILFQCFQTLLLNQWQTLTLQLINMNNINLKETAMFLIYCFGLAQVELQFFHHYVLKVYEITINQSLYDLNNFTYFFEIQWLHQVFKTWSTILSKLQSKQTVQFEAIASIIINSQKTYQLLQATYSFKSPAQIFICVNQKSQEINSLKYSAAEFNQVMLKYAKSPKVFQHLLMVIQKITKTVGALCMDTSSIQKWSCEDYLTSLLSILILFYKYYGKTAIGQTLWPNFHQYIIYPLLKLTQQEKVDFEEDFQSFNAINEDCCDRQEMNVLKTQTAKLLQTIGDIHLQSVQYAMNRSIQSIKLALGFVNAKEDNELRRLDVQTSFLIISICSYQLSKMNQQIQALREILCNNSIFQLRPLQTSRLFLFLAYNYSQVFPEAEDGAHLIAYALKYKKHNTTFLAGLDFISNVADDFYSDQFFMAVIQLVHQHSNSIIYTIINRILDSSPQKISEQILVNLVNIMFLKIQKQNIKIKQQESQQTHLIVLCLHVLQNVICKINYLMKKNNKNYENVKQLLWKVINFIDQAAKYNIEDEIIKIINQYLHSESVISQLCQAILPKIIYLFQHDKYLRGPYFVFFNQCIMKTNTQNIKQIINLFKTGLMYHSMDLDYTVQKNLQKIAVANHLLLVQNILAVHGVNLQQEDIFQISSICMKFIPEQSQQTATYESTIVTRALNVLVLCHMHAQNPECIRYLLRFHDQRLYRGYQTKVLLECINKQIFRQNDLVMIGQLIQIMVRVFKQSNEIDIKERMQKINKKTLSVKIVKKSNDFETIFKYLNTPFDKELNEVKLIKQMISQMKSNNSAIYSQIMKSLSPDIVEELKKIQQIQNNGNKPIIKIKGIKQNMNNFQNQTISKRPNTIQYVQSSEDEQQSQLSHKKQRKKKRNLN